MASLGVFSHLPVEIRLQIWEYAVASDEAGAVTFRLDDFQRQFYHAACQPSLTRVNRELRSEALPAFYETSNFVLHTGEGPKADDALRWLRCNQEYLGRIKKISFWIRHIPLGAIGISLSRKRRGESWSVDTDWKWITVLRKPASAETSANHILSMLNKSGMLSDVSSETTTPEDYFTLMTRLRALRTNGSTT